VTQTQAEERFVHRGHVAVAGFFYANREENWTRSDILARYVSGTRVFRHQGTLLVIFPQVQRAAVMECPATPLVWQKNWLTALPLEETDSSPPGLPVSLAYAGNVEGSALDKSHEEDPAAWVDLRDFSKEDGKSLRPPPRPPQQAIAKGETNIRNMLGAIGREHPEQKELVKALRSSGARRPQGPRVGATLAAAGIGILARISSLISTRFRRSGTPQLPGEPPVAPRNQPSSHSPSLLDRFSNYLKTSLWKSRMGQWLGQQHSKYLEELFNLLNQGSFEEALRRAIPAHNRSSGGQAAPPVLPFGRRDHLELGAAQGSGGTLGLEEALYAQLRAAYRRAFEQLKAHQRHNEAAYVLSELLQENEEAVNYLEVNGCIEKAAQLAEARDLSAGLIVRLWFRAGNRERAMAIAKRDGAFEDALLRLKEHPKDAEAFRLAWASHLADAGNFASAIQIASPLPEAKAIVRKWIDLGLEQGGSAGASALVQFCRLYPEHFSDVREHALALLTNQERFDSAALETMARQLLKVSPPNRAVRTLSRSLFRATLRDRGLGLNSIERSTLRDLARLGDDGALAADLPQLTATDELPRLINRSTPVTQEVSANDTGSSPIHDAVMLGGGRYLIAKGDSGVFLYNRGHRVVRHFDLPATKLIVSDQSDRVLALRQRGELTVVFQIAPASGTGRMWTEMKLDSYALTFDGSSWYVAFGGFVHALDLSNPSQKSLWRSGNTESNIVGISRTPHRLLFSTGNGECWEHDLNPHRLRRRHQSPGLPILGGATHDVWFGRGDTPSDTHEGDDELFNTTGDARPDVEIANWSEGDEGDFEDDRDEDFEEDEERTSSPLFLELRRDDRRSLTLGAENEASQFTVQDSDDIWIIVSYANEGSQVLVLTDRAELKARMRVTLKDTGWATARLSEGSLIISDQRGRLLAFELGAGTRLFSERL